MKPKHIYSILNFNGKLIPAIGPYVIITAVDLSLCHLEQDHIHVFIFIFIPTVYTHTLA